MVFVCYIVGRWYFLIVFVVVLFVLLVVMD